MILPCMLTGRDQEVLPSLNEINFVKFVNIVKADILKTYTIVPEMYHQQLRGRRRGDMYHLDFACDL